MIVAEKELDSNSKRISGILSSATENNVKRKTEENLLETMSSHIKDLYVALGPVVKILVDYQDCLDAIEELWSEDSGKRDSPVVDRYNMEALLSNYDRLKSRMLVFLIIESLLTLTWGVLVVDSSLHVFSIISLTLLLTQSASGFVLAFTVGNYLNEIEKRIMKVSQAVRMTRVSVFATVFIPPASPIPLALAFYLTSREEGAAAVLANIMSILKYRTVSEAISLIRNAEILVDLFNDVEEASSSRISFEFCRTMNRYFANNILMTSFKELSNLREDCDTYEKLLNNDAETILKFYDPLVYEELMGYKEMQGKLEKTVEELRFQERLLKDIYGAMEYHEKGLYEDAARLLNDAVGILREKEGIDWSDQYLSLKNSGGRNNVVDILTTVKDIESALLKRDSDTISKLAMNLRGIIERTSPISGSGNLYLDLAEYVLSQLAEKRGEH